MWALYENWLSGKKNPEKGDDEHVDGFCLCRCFLWDAGAV